MKYIPIRIVELLTKRSAFVLMAIALSLLSIVVRVPIVAMRPLIGFEMGDDATSHVLAVCQGWNAVPSANHLWLPSVTQDMEASRGINSYGGAASLTADGLSIYTSYPSGVFLVAAAYFKVSGMAPNVPALRALSVAFHLVSATLLVMLVRRLMRARFPSLGVNYVVLSVILAAWLFNPEALRSFSISFWGQHVNQVLIPLVALLLLENGKVSRLGAWAVLLVACFMEYSALCSAVMVGMAFLWIYYSTRQRQMFAWGGAFLAIPVLFCILDFKWFALKIPLHEYLSNVVHRAGSNSSAGSGAVQAVLYLLSIAAVPLVLAAFVKHRPTAGVLEGVTLRSIPRKFPTMLMALAVLGGACLENIVMANHVKTYPYDTLKVLYFGLVLLGCYSYTEKPVDSFRQLFAILALTPFFILNYFNENRAVLGKKDSIYFYERMGNLVRRESDKHCVVFSNYGVRGAEIFYAGRNIENVGGEFALVAKPELIQKIRNRCKELGFSQGLLITADPANLKTIVVMTKLDTDSAIVESRLVNLNTLAD